MGKGNAWTRHVTSFYKDMKRKNPAYKFKNALRDAKSTFKKRSKQLTDAIVAPLRSITQKRKSTRRKRTGTRHRKRRGGNETVNENPMNSLVGSSASP
jgi:hypothetical protein